MPSQGFKSITVTDAVYDKFFSVFDANKEELHMKGITSFAGYVTSQINEIIHRDRIYSKYKARFEVISIESEFIILNDNKLKRIAEINRTSNPPLFCHLCKSNTCSHIGFCFSLPQIYPIEGGIIMKKKERGERENS